MTLLLSAQVDAPVGSKGSAAALDQFGQAIGVPGSQDSFGFIRQARNTPDLSALRNYAGGVIARLQERSAQLFDPSFVGSGTQPVVGSGANSHHPSTLDEPSSRVYYTQSPKYSVIIKKKMFSGLQDLYKPELMSPGETWLLRATKRLIARKCAIMADYERISKIEKINESVGSPSEIMQGLMAASALGAELEGEAENPAEFEAIKEIQRAAFDRQSPNVTTYYVDPESPLITPLGLGTGTFEITAIATLSTSLSIEGEGSCSFTIEDPYQILIITEADIEAALLETALTNYVSAVNQRAADALLRAQELDRELTELRSGRNVSAITFSVSVQGGKPSATIDALGMNIDSTNIDDVPDEQALNATERTIFTQLLSNLEIYNRQLTLAYRQGAGNLDVAKVRDQMNYARKKMRLYFLGKSIVQAMDSVHVFIDGGTRRFGEGEDPISQGIPNISDLVRSFFDQRGSDQLQFNEEAIKEEYNKKFKGKTSLSFEDFKMIRGLDLSGNGTGMHVFGGLVQNVTDKYVADQGKFTLSVQCTTNMEWLRFSRYNTQPALTQTEAIVYDPLTPFLIQTDPATGLPTGKLELTPENKERLGSCALYFNNGSNIGKRVRNEQDLSPDQRALGGNVISLYDHIPGMLYRWKDGIMTTTYNVQTVDPKDKSFVSRETMYREIGFFASKTPFDNMDAANIISTLVTGFPYNYTTFVQSALQTGAFVPDTALNNGTDFFHTFLNVARSLNNVQGSFVPFKLLNTDSKEMADSLAQALGAQLQLSGLSNRMQQLRGQLAELDDRIIFLENTESRDLAAELRNQRSRVKEEIKQLSATFTTSARNAPQSNNAVYVAGSDVVFDLTNINDGLDYRNFGDRLLYQLLRRREDVIYNRDKNYLVISDEYDKDYDIQAFVLRLRQQSPELWKNSYQSPYELCKTVAETLNFEFFADTQGHLVFRPPQYNRTPLSVLEAMFLLDRNNGIRLFPDFLLNLFKRREDSIIADTIALELRIKLQAALLGASDSTSATSLLSRQISGGDLLFISDREDLQKAIAKNQAISPEQRIELERAVSQANFNSKVGELQSGTFSPISQLNLQSLALQEFASNKRNSNKDYYEEIVEELIALTGAQKNSFPEFDDAKVGATRNGQSTPSTDVANITTKIANLVSRRSKLLRILGRVLSQNTQVVELSEDGNQNLKKGNFSNASNLVGTQDQLTGVLAKIVEDTRKDTLGHLSSQRFIIRDEHIKEQSFTEQPPSLTNVRVAGTDPIVGEGGGNAFGGFPQYLALGVDFDMWRQYGWRGEQTFDKPFFWDAELQCAPYAVMLLSRQRKNVIKGNVRVFGNEFYQLGDVVYHSGRQLLYYVSAISHNASFDGSFDTTLQLTYGHPPGEYIPTPLDVIGKSITSRSGTQNAFRMRRLTPITESPVRAVLKFGDEPTLDSLLSGKHGARNLNQLKKMALAFKKDLTTTGETSPRLYIMGFTDSEDHTSQIEAVKSWFINPQKGAVAGNNVGPDGAGGTEPTTVSDVNEDGLSQFTIDPEFLFDAVLRQCSADLSDLTTQERNLLKQGLVASDEAYRLANEDNEETAELDKIIEIRLRFPPSGGWEDDE